MIKIPPDRARDAVPKGSLRLPAKLPALKSRSQEKLAELQEELQGQRERAMEWEAKARELKEKAAASQAKLDAAGYGK